MSMRVPAGLALAVAACAAACTSGEEEAAERRPADADVAEARAAAAELGGALIGELTTAIAAEGAASAIDVCRDVAQASAQDLSARLGLEVGRTSLRVRNPANAPDAWERVQLEAFVAAVAEGADAASLEHAEIVIEDGAPVMRWMKAIPMGGLCAQCHGEDIAPEVEAAIATAYPDDQATGFRLGEVRGAFTVRKPLDAE